uniref:TM2 domain containing 3 n=1 Tax=Mus musculus TaxID=10090 RepID=A0A0U1RNF7_MOUSE
MEAAAEPLRSVRHLSRVLLFLSQCYILSGDGSRPQTPEELRHQHDLQVLLAAS